MKGGMPGGVGIDGNTVVIIGLVIMTPRSGSGREGGAVSGQCGGGEGGGGCFRGEEEARELGLLSCQAVGELLLFKQQSLDGRICFRQKVISFSNLTKLLIPGSDSTAIHLLRGEGSFFGRTQLCKAGFALGELCSQRSGDLGQSGRGRGIAQSGKCGQGGFEAGNLLTDELELVVGRVR
jgi:hypothetical protein